MIRIKIYRNQNKDIYRFSLDGHAGFAEEGEDIVCCAVSVLTVNTINALERFTEEVFTCDVDEKNGGFLDFELIEMKDGRHSHDARLLLETMVCGLKDIENEYGHYIKMNDEEV